MRYFILTLMLTCAANLLFAQSAERFVIATAGNTVSGSSYMVSYTLGETIISNYNSSSLSVGSGFQQSSPLSTSIEERSVLDYSVKAFPNPTTERITLDFSTDRSIDIQLRVLDLNGREMPIKKSVLQINNGSKELIDFSNYASGNYLIELIDDKGRRGNIQIIKQ